MIIDTPLVMGIINVTPDSFYRSSRAIDESLVISTAEKMIADGAGLLDVGGYSSRPGASDIPIDMEINRVIPAIKILKDRFPKTVLSIDTFRSKVAEVAINAGADVINDISGGELDSKMFDLVIESKTPFIMMHMKGSPQTMNSLANYDNIILEITDYFKSKIDYLKERGHNDIILDPGFGFAKTIDQNFELLKGLANFKVFELPLLVGLSRKSVIYKSLGILPDNALNGTTALNMIALQNGASILRVHDVKEAVEATKLFNLTYIN